MNEDSIKLLKKCNTGCKYATDSMEQILPYISNARLKKLVEDYNKKHISIGDECHQKLNEAGKDEEDPGKISRAAAWLGTEIKLIVDSGSDRVAEILIDGCNMGIKSISRFFNKYKDADSEIKDLVYELISIEQDFMNELLSFL